jgi:hypothetical protein
MIELEARAETPLQKRRQVAALAAHQARHLYSKARGQAAWAQFWARLARRSLRLASLAEVAATSDIRARRSLGVQTIALRLIRGSEGRSSEFDTAFRPRQNHIRARWISVAIVMHQGFALPPIEVIQMGDHYFVRDGHHRVSVARAMGQADIEANVTIWELAEAGATAPEAGGLIRAALRS